MTNPRPENTKVNGRPVAPAPAPGGPGAPEAPKEGPSHNEGEAPHTDEG